MLSPTKADLSVELKSFCGMWQFFLRLLPYHSHMLYNLSSPWPKHKALSASQRKEKLPLKKEKKILHFNAYVWESGSSEHRKIENSHTLPHIQCNVNALGSSLHKHIMYTQGPVRGGNSQKYKDIKWPTHITTHVLCCLVLPIAAPKVLMASCSEGRNSVRCGCKCMCVDIDSVLFLRPSLS